MDGSRLCGLHPNDLAINCANTARTFKYISSDVQAAGTPICLRQKIDDVLMLMVTVLMRFTPYHIKCARQRYFADGLCVERTLSPNHRS